MIDLVTYNERLVHSVSDAIFYENISADGILYGMGYESSGNKVTIFSGYGIIKGRVFEITGQEEVNIPQVTSGSVNGQIIIQIDLSNSDNPIQLIADNTMRELTQNPQFNYLAGVWEVQLATYSVTPIGVVNIDRVFNKIQGDEYVLSQLQSLTETVTNHGTRINNQANRLTTLESKQYEYSIRNVSKANVEIVANGSKSEEITISLTSGERLIGWVDKWIDSTGTSSPANQTSCVCVNWWGNGTTRTVSVRNFANSKARITINISALVAKKV